MEELLARVAEHGQKVISSFVKNQKIVAHDSPPDLTTADYKMDLTDDIFSTLQSVGFPHQTSRDFRMYDLSQIILKRHSTLERPPHLFFIFIVSIQQCNVFLLLCIFFALVGLHVCSAFIVIHLCITVGFDNSDFMQPQLLGLEPDLDFGDFRTPDSLQGI